MNTAEKDKSLTDPIPFALDEIDDSTPHHLAEVRCPNCTVMLVLHEPDVDVPERLLGTCSACRTWYVMDCKIGLMARLPDLTEHAPSSRNGDAKSPATLSRSKPTNRRPRR